MSKFVELSVIILNILVITSIVNHHQKYNKLKKEILGGEGEVVSVIGNSTECKAKGRENYKCSKLDYQENFYKLTKCQYQKTVSKRLLHY